MKTTLSYQEDGQAKVETRILPNDEQGFWREVATLLPILDVPSTYRIRAQRSDGFASDAKLDITARGTFMRDGVELPSMFVIPAYNDIALPSDKYEDAYLTCINPDSRGGRGNYKFYRLSQKPDGTVTAFYGRIGQRSGFGAEREIKDPMPSWMFEIRKAEKMTKGYVDRSATCCKGEVHVVGDGVPAASASAGSGNLYQKLLAYAKGRVSSSLVAGIEVTSAQVDECGKLITRIGRCRKVSSFNERLLDLMSLSPRNVTSVAAELAESPSDFKRIIDREESLIAAMRAVADSRDSAHVDSAADGFAANSIGWRLLDASEKDGALAHVPSKLRHRVRNVYQIEPCAQRARFSAYLSAHGMSGSDVRLMWHGSRNENWCSIISRSLMLNPTAKITGKMFGHGIYFGYDDQDNGALKSWNYTSANGSCWANGTSSTAFMGLYECAYGRSFNPVKVQSFDKAWLSTRGFDCVHARGGNCGLMHDEVVFFDEAAVCIKYLFEFAA